ncbi:MAG: hypothetical protein A2X52_14430 [Candidatus Rokubacteria bacterium GWC2_70_16]|nr:MAG: hypothetical protein A2X52_14430 [Candidatus Rokubacteria bacterium GWC2_70_16]
MTLRFVPTGALMVALLSAPLGAGAATDAPWKTHQDQTCGIELKYPPSYSLEASGARDYCALWIRIGVREARGLRTLFSLEITEMQSADRVEAAKTRTPPSARDFALHVATNQCTADGADSSTSCTNGEVRSTFKTAQGFRGFEIHLTEVHESFAPKKIEKRRRGPIFALDLSDDVVVRVLMASGEPARLGELKAILDTFRVWSRARRPTPRVVEMDPFRLAPQTFVLRVAVGEQDRASRWPPSPVTNWLLTDPRGRRLGRDPATGTWYSEAPAVTHSTAAESGFMLREPVEGRYELQITASVPSVPYHVAVRAPDRAGMPATARHAGRTAEPGAVDRYEVVYTPGSTPAVTIAEVRDFSRFTILLSSRADAVSDLILTDPQGRHTGLDPVGTVERRTIPRSSYVDEGPGRRSLVLDVRQPMDGAYTLQVTGTAPGSYSLDLRAWDRSGTATARPELRDMPTAPGVVHVYRLAYASTARTPLTLGGRFDGDRFLAYANPASIETRLRAGVTSFPLVIFYGARVKPVTFNALLNGDNITGRFTPEPEGSQIVRIPLGPGLNTLVLSIEGTSASGQTTTDTHRLVFRVE